MRTPPHARVDAQAAGTRAGSGRARIRNRSGSEKFEGPHRISGCRRGVRLSDAFPRGPLRCVERQYGGGTHRATGAIARRSPAVAQAPWALHFPHSETQEDSNTNGNAVSAIAEGHHHPYFGKSQV